MKPYKPYYFKTYDPIMNEIATAIGTRKKSEVSQASGVPASTISNWLKHKTKRPQCSTAFAVLLSSGVEGIKFVNGKPKLIFKK